MQLELKDPRRFSSIYPKSNILIAQALTDLANNNDNQLMLALIDDLLAKSEDSLLTVAYNLAPNQAVANYIWDSLHLVLNDSNLEHGLKLIAFPVILITNSLVQVKLNNQIDQSRLMELFLNKKIFLNGSRCKISGKLYDLAGLNKLMPSSFYHLHKIIPDLSAWDDELLSYSAVVNLDQGVHLRFLIAASVEETALSSNFIAENFNQLGLELMELLVAELKLEAVELLALPFYPCNLSEAGVIGEHHRKEIDFTLNLSNLVREMRLKGFSPLVKLSAQKNNIQVELWDANAYNSHEILLWHLHPADNFAEIMQTIAELLMNMQLDIEYYTQDEQDD